jgi:hypothetical protein
MRHEAPMVDAEAYLNKTATQAQRSRRSLITRRSRRLVRNG